MNTVNRDNFAALVNAQLDEVDREKRIRRFTIIEGQLAWDGKPADVQPDEAVKRYARNVIDIYAEMPDNMSD